MGEYTNNYSLYLPSVGETGWGSLVNQNFVLIDQNLPVTANDGSKWFINNASYNKNTDTWTQIDTAKSSNAIHLRNNGYVEVLTCAAGNSAITWQTSPINVDMAEVHTTTGTVNINGGLKTTGKCMPVITSSEGGDKIVLAVGCRINHVYGLSEWHTVGIGFKGKFKTGGLQSDMSLDIIGFDLDTGSYVTMTFLSNGATVTLNCFIVAASSNLNNYGSKFTLGSNNPTFILY